MDSIKEVFAETIPKVSVSVKQTVKVQASFAEIESSKAM
jgi:hypothetical protein